ncbi:hypothetical protein J2TS6_03310 [Paenibacillus albilobatus]|uniref:Uncharacterized protein n=1 Tax=Paenibacillus albilobatus TaxID=2716884 RepID=A0A919XDV3_9BACL|nr:hypothetical protein J2TS6_03310 [Paenibacillus albilobatus]
MPGGPGVPVIPSETEGMMPDILRWIFLINSTKQSFFIRVT